MVQARKILDEMKDKESGRDPLRWAVTVVFVYPMLVFAYYFLMKDFARHERLENLLLTHLSFASSVVGVNLALGRRSKSLSEPSFALYSVLTVITGGLFWIYWNYRLISDPESHFSSQWDIEDDFYTTLRGNVTQEGLSGPPRRPSDSERPP